jgi:predicted lysophospholipase L1 biosynthesis ABC-type transport system permease subunit
VPLKVVAAEAVKTTNVTAAERMVKKEAVNIGDAVNVGNNIYKVTNTLGSVPI